jgi:3',5'-cyclic-AMP phosphodiesterase
MIIAQISDPHITLEEEAAVHLQRAVAHLMALPALPDVVLVTGDCVNSGHLDEYVRFQELLRPLTMPVYVIPGNHDHRARMLEAFGTQGAQPLTGFVQYVVDAWPVRLVALDTHIPERDEGYLCAERLQWLEERLAEAPTRPTMVFMHHPPFRSGLAVPDQIGLVGADALAAIIARHPQVERIVAGHLHMAMLGHFAGTLAMTCPATGHTLLPDLGRPERLAALIEPPACLVHVWDDSSGLVTYTSLIGDHGPVVELHDGERWLS